MIIKNMFTTSYIIFWASDLYCLYMYWPERDVISESQWSIPSWVKNSAGWWYEEKISDDDFINIIENLVKRKIIVL